MAISTFDGPVRSLNGFYSQGPGNILTLDATITLNATTTGGAARGSQITLVALAANLWSVNGVLVGSGTVATPFS